MKFGLKGGSSTTAAMKESNEYLEVSYLAENWREENESKSLDSRKGSNMFDA